MSSSSLVRLSSLVMFGRPMYVVSRPLSSVVGRRVPRLSFDGLLSAVAPSSPSRCECMLLVGVIRCVL